MFGLRVNHRYRKRSVAWTTYLKMALNEEQRPLSSHNHAILTNPEITVLSVGGAVGRRAVGAVDRRSCCCRCGSAVSISYTPD